MTVIYDDSFNINEWFVIISIVGLGFIVWITPKLFSLLEGGMYFIYGVFIGMFFDHTLSVKPWDFYDVNDVSKYQLMDFLSYIMYGPYSYFFIYLYQKLKIRGFMNLFYVVLWSGISLLIGWISQRIGLFHYNKGYHVTWSFPIYLLTQTIEIILYHLVKRKTISCVNRRERFN